MSAACLAGLITMTYSDFAHASGRGAKAEGRMAAKDVTFNCRPGRIENKLQFGYTVVNNSGSDIYVLDALPAVDPKTRQAIVNMDGAYVAKLDGNAAYVLRGIPPLPRSPVAVRIIPLGTKVEPGATLERSFTIPLPLAEQSPYYGDLPLRSYEQNEVDQVIVGLQFLRSTAEGFGAVPAEFGSGVYRVQSRQTVRDAETLICSFPTKNLVVLKRTDPFTRVEPPQR